MRPVHSRYPALGEPDPFGGGGLPWQLDSVLFSLEDASRREDAREYASLAAQLAVIVAPKLTPEEYADLSVPVVPDVETPGVSRRARRRDYERNLFIAARRNVATILRLLSDRGIYAKKDESPAPTFDGSGLAIVEESVLDAPSE